MSKLFKNFVGIDISKAWFDAAIILTKKTFAAPFHEQFTQTADGFIVKMDWSGSVSTRLLQMITSLFLYGVHRPCTTTPIW